jgi:predicted transcriptional regulator
MACLQSDDILSRSGALLLLTLTTPSTLEHVAKKTNMPLFQVRSTARSLLRAGLLCELNDQYEMTTEGIKRLEGE